MDRKEEIRREMDRLTRELGRLEALPDGANMPSGTVLAVAIEYSSSGRLYHYVGLKVAGRWYFTGRGSPNGVTWSEVERWITAHPRRLVAAADIARLDVNIPGRLNRGMIDMTPLISGGFGDGPDEALSAYLGLESD